jgi:hypothetical protein
VIPAVYIRPAGVYDDLCHSAFLESGTVAIPQLPTLIAIAAQAWLQHPVRSSNPAGGIVLVRANKALIAKGAIWRIEGESLS